MTPQMHSETCKSVLMPYEPCDCGMDNHAVDYFWNKANSEFKCTCDNGPIHLMGCASRISLEDQGSLCNCTPIHDTTCAYFHTIEETNKMPGGEGKRDKERHHYEYIPLEFLDMLAEIFEEGRRPRPGMPEGYGDSWKSGGKNFLRDCLNHAVWHLWKYFHGDRTEHHLAKVAWNVLAVAYHSKEKENAQTKSSI